MRSKIWQHLQWLLLIPPIVAATLLGSRWLHSSKPMAVAKQQVQLATPTDQEKREYVLEVIGLGVTLDKYRQGKLWEALQTGNAYASIREQDTKKYPWSSLDKAGTSGGRAGDSLENGALNTPMYFAVPIFNAEGPIADPAQQDTPHAPIMGLAGSASSSSGMHWHLFVGGAATLRRTSRAYLGGCFRIF